VAAYSDDLCESSDSNECKSESIPICDKKPHLSNTDPYSEKKSKSPKLSRKAEHTSDESAAASNRERHTKRSSSLAEVRIVSSDDSNLQSEDRPKRKKSSHHKKEQVTGSSSSDIKSPHKRTTDSKDLNSTLRSREREIFRTFSPLQKNGYWKLVDGVRVGPEEKKEIEKQMSSKKKRKSRPPERYGDILHTERFF